MLSAAASSSKQCSLQLATAARTWEFNNSSSRPSSIRRCPDHQDYLLVTYSSMNMFSILAFYLFRSSVTIHCLSSSFPPFPGLSQQDSLWVHAGQHHQEPGSQWLGRDDTNQLLQTVSFSIREFFQIIYEITGSGWWQDLGKNVLRPLM